MAEYRNVPLARTSWRRDYAGEVRLPVKNRFFEQDPTSTEDPTAMLARPGTDYRISVGGGPMRGNFAQEGFFDGDMFVASGQQLFRWDGETLLTIAGALSSNDGPVSMAAQTVPGVEDSDRLWIADGENLLYYEGEAKARGSLTATGQVSDGDVVEIGGIYYRFSTANVDDNSPAGTMTNPWRVLIGTDLENSMENLGAAIGGSGIPGGTYSTALTPHPTVEVRRVEPARVQVQAKAAGSGGNSITTTETGSTLAWGAATLANGGDHFLTVAPVPEGEGNQNATSVTALNSYVILSVAGTDRMYAVRPGEFWVEVFFTAESEPDAVVQVITVGDYFWALGKSTIEPFAANNNPDFPFVPVRGAAKRYGVIPGTAVVIDDDVIFSDDRGIVRNTAGERLSTNSIEEEIRLRVRSA